MDMPTSSPNTSEQDCDFSVLNTSWVPPYIYTISALGIPLNLLVLLVFLLHRQKCTATEIYLSNLAAADLLLVVLMPLWAVNEANNYHWTFGGPMCTILSLPIVMNYNCSIYFLVLVSIDRFFALVYPLKQCILRRRKYAMLGCFLVWCLGLLLNIPILMCRKVKFQDDLLFDEIKEYICSVDCYFNIFVSYDVIQTIVASVIPLLIILFCTVKIVHALTRRPSNRNSTQQMEHKATILVLTVFLAFFICWLPFSLTRMTELAVLFELIEETCNFRWHQLYSYRIIFLNVGFFNSALNPVLYVIVSKNFRKKMWEVGRGQRSMRPCPTGGLPQAS
ncbi:B2 bradykinin receptor-like [Periophthalmus magnuspinnatus]|uniref:B2 bradykinin receptor-like n=1 Tax=Periophthalmus magnuspinnatus TaxID=409849 RepID=UPI0024364B81|nr:B2 bradykinin receptor-like [Periophthalmus magnuspinnatus]